MRPRNSGGFTVAVKRWKLRVDPDSTEPDRIERDRDAHVSETFRGTVVADATLPAIGGATFKTVFDRLVDAPPAAATSPPSTATSTTSNPSPTAGTTPANGRVACNPDNRARPHRRFHNDPDPYLAPPPGNHPAHPGSEPGQGSPSQTYSESKGAA